MSDNCGRNGLMKKRLFTVEEELELAIYDAIHDLIREQILYQAGQRTKEKYSYYRQQDLKLIHTSYKRLLKLKYRLSVETLQEMVDGSIHDRDFLPTLSAEYLEGTPEEKEKIINSLDLDQLNRDTFTLVISYLKRKGCFKKAKGFSGETII
ncbi:MAG: hypothetical protein QNJ60_01840 [Xenococcaceae cyanobacterium MO_188.B19]|nr:hypothetical protein [Xenococcaceae cyanobacterium MO_188.B19]